MWLALPATFGSVIGALAAVNISSGIMETVIGFLLLFMFFIVLYKPEKWISEKAGSITGRPRFWQLVIFFLIGLYGGFIQAGVGFMLLGGLVLGAGLNLTKANALKVFIVFMFTIVALVVFIINRQVDYLSGVILAIGSMAGAWAAAKFAIRKGPAIIRIILLVIIMVSALKYIGLFGFIKGLF
jgi:uncharacterized membrane protein YfcA